METISALLLQLTTPVQPVPLCSRKGLAHHHAYTKIWSLVHRWTYTTSADKRTESWDSSKQSGIAVLRNSHSPSLALVKSKRDAQTAAWVDKKEQNDSAIGIILSLWKAVMRESSLVKRLDYSCCDWTIAGGKCPRVRKMSLFTGKSCVQI